MLLFPNRRQHVKTKKILKKTQKKNEKNTKLHWKKDEIKSQMTTTLFDIKNFSALKRIIIIITIIIIIVIIIAAIKCKYRMERLRLESIMEIDSSNTSLFTKKKKIKLATRMIS